MELLRSPLALLPPIRDPLPMKSLRICYAKESGHPSGGKGALPEPAGGPLSPSAGSTAGIESCPFGIPVRVTGGGHTATAIRSEYLPNWLDENRDKPLPFTPESWESV